MFRCTRTHTFLLNDAARSHKYAQQTKWNDFFSRLSCSYFLPFVFRLFFYTFASPFLLRLFFPQTKKITIVNNKTESMISWLVRFVLYIKWGKAIVSVYDMAVCFIWLVKCHEDLKWLQNDSLILLGVWCTFDRGQYRISLKYQSDEFFHCVTNLIRSNSV